MKNPVRVHQLQTNQNISEVRACMECQINCEHLRVLYDFDWDVRVKETVAAIVYKFHLDGVLYVVGKHSKNYR